MPIQVTVCAGSSCHVRGSRALLKRFAEIIQSEGLGDRVVLVGSFCMERCGEGMNWRFDEEDVSSTSVDEAVATLRQKLGAALAGARG